MPHCCRSFRTRQHTSMTGVFPLLPPPARAHVSLGSSTEMAPCVLDDSCVIALWGRVGECGSLLRRQPASERSGAPIPFRLLPSLSPSALCAAARSVCRQLLARLLLARFWDVYTHTTHWHVAHTPEPFHQNHSRMCLRIDVARFSARNAAPQQARQQSAGGVSGTLARAAPNASDSSNLG